MCLTPCRPATEHRTSPQLMQRRRPIEIALSAPDGRTAAWGRVYVRSMGPIDGVDVSVRGLSPATTYTLFLMQEDSVPVAPSMPLATIITDAKGGAALVEAVTAVPLPDLSGTSGRRLVLVEGLAPDGPAALSARVPRER